MPAIMSTGGSLNPLTTKPGLGTDPVEVKWTACPNLSAARHLSLFETAATTRQSPGPGFVREDHPVERPVRNVLVSENTIRENRLIPAVENKLTYISWSKPKIP